MKRILILLLTMIMTLELSLSIVSADMRDKCDEDSIVNTISSVECIKDQIGLTDIDFGELYYSEKKILSYEYTNDGLICNAEYIAIGYKDSLIGWVIKSFYEDEVSYQFSTEFIEQLPLLIDSGTEFAFIYDANGCYLYDGTKLQKIKEVSLHTNRANLSLEECFDMDILIGKYNFNKKISYPNNGSKAAIYYSCNVSNVTQKPYQNLCWAASTACIVNYKNGTNLTALSVAQNWYGMFNYNQSLLLSYNDDVINSYSLLYTYKYRIPTESVIVNNISNNYPIEGTFQHTTGYHNVVIYGINISSGYLYIMDPMTGFRSISYSSGGISFVCEGTLMTLCAGTCRYW